MCKGRETERSGESKKTRGEYFGSNQWMEEIAEVMKKINNDPNLTYEQKRQALEDYRRALSAIN